METSSSSVDPMLRRIAALLGWISLFATLALLSPGVVAIANAAESEPEAGPSCPASRLDDEHGVIGLERMVEGLRADAAARDDGSTGVVSLNTRGYNYTNASASPEPKEGRR
jgi:hypothetical protein